MAKSVKMMSYQQFQEQQYDNSKLILTYSDDESGYIVSEAPDGQMFTTIWVEGNDDTRRISYIDSKRLYEKAVLMSKSGIAHYTPFHSAQTKMFLAYIDHYNKDH
jgi:hypothetical protein